MDMLVSRPYDRQRDWQPVIDLLRTCRAVEPIDPWPPIYDLRHHLRAPPDSADTQIWEHRGGGLAAVATIWDGMTLIFAIHPQAMSEELTGEMLRWGVARTRELARHAGEQATLLVPICADDRSAAALLERQGWRAEDWSFLRMARPLAAPIAEPWLPNGFTLRPVSSTHDLAAAAALYQDIFVAGASLIRERLALRRTSDHVLASDIVVVAPDGSLAAFCLCTAGPLDPRFPEHADGWIELVGTRQAYRRCGLGRAALLAGLQQLTAFGADRALLGTASWNVAAQQLFAAMDFRLLHEIRWYAWAEEA